MSVRRFSQVIANVAAAPSTEIMGWSVRPDQEPIGSGTTFPLASKKANQTLTGRPCLYSFSASLIKLGSNPDSVSVMPRAWTFDPSSMDEMLPNCPTPWNVAPLQLSGPTPFQM